jgi:hypothetical protein
MRKNQESTIEVVQIRTGRMTLLVRGKTPFIANAMSQKVRQELLAPAGRKSTHEKATSIKHNPIEEYRGSIYAYTDNDHPTRIHFPAGGFKKAAMTTALEMPGVSKASIARLLWVEGLTIDIFGIPQMLMSVTRSADINHTPDVHTRAIIPNWAARIDVSFVMPKITEQQIANLFVGAGLMVGVGDWRVEKGSGTFGQFELVDADDKTFHEIIRIGGREAQDKAMQEPAFYDLETERLFTWFEGEMRRRAKAGRASIVANGTADSAA